MKIWSHNSSILLFKISRKQHKLFTLVIFIYLLTLFLHLANNVHVKSTLSTRQPLPGNLSEMQRRIEVPVDFPKQH